MYRDVTLVAWRSSGSQLESTRAPCVEVDLKALRTASDMRRCVEQKRSTLYQLMFSLVREYSWLYVSRMVSSLGRVVDSRSQGKILRFMRHRIFSCSWVAFLDEEL